MKKTIFMDKYPVYSIEIAKSETKLSSVDEIIQHLKSKIDEHKVACFISIFDHYSHTKSIDGEINSDIKDAKNIIFCFGKAIPNSKILAARPRSIGVCELENSFMIDFLEAPREDLNVLKESWIRSIIIE